MLYAICCEVRDPVELNQTRPGDGPQVGVTSSVVNLNAALAAVGQRTQTGTRDSREAALTCGSPPAADITPAEETELLRVFGTLADLHERTRLETYLQVSSAAISAHRPTAPPSASQLRLVDSQDAANEHRCGGHHTTSTNASTRASTRAPRAPTHLRSPVTQTMTTTPHRTIMRC